MGFNPQVYYVLSHAYFFFQIPIKYTYFIVKEPPAILVQEFEAFPKFVHLRLLIMMLKVPVVAVHSVLVGSINYLMLFHWRKN